MSTKQEIINGLDEIGAAFAVRSDKCVLPGDPDRKPAYHIHPDKTRPEQGAEIRFFSLDEIAEYIKAAKVGTEEAMELFWDWLDGSRESK